MTNEPRTPVIKGIPFTPQEATNVQVIQAQTIEEPPIIYKQAFAYSKSVKIFSGIELLFLFIYGIYQPWLWLQAFGPIIGFHGANTFKKCPSLFYFTYLIMAFILKFTLLILTFEQYYNDFFYIILAIVSIIIDLWIIKIVSRFIQILQELSTDDIPRLQNMRIITKYVFW